MAIPIPPRVLAATRRMRLQALALIRRGADLDESTVLVGFAVAIGVAVGLAVLVFYKMIDLFQALALRTADRLTWFGALDIMVVVALGLSAAYLIVRYGARASDGTIR